MREFQKVETAKRSGAGLPVDANEALLHTLEFLAPTRHNMSATVATSNDEEHCIANSSQTSRVRIGRDQGSMWVTSTPVQEVHARLRDQFPETVPWYDRFAYQKMSTHREATNMARNAFSQFEELLKNYEETQKGNDFNYEGSDAILFDRIKAVF